MGDHVPKVTGKAPPQGAALGARCRWYREQAGISQERLADILAMSQQGLSQWELDKHPYPDWAVSRLAQACRVSVRKLRGAL